MSRRTARSFTSPDACPAGLDVRDAAPMHSDRATIDDGVLDLHAATLADLVWERLRRGV